jgi:acyl-coenzyme A thioesterase PaaI-like protein
MPLSGEDIMRQFLPTSPYVAHLGISLVSIQPGEAVLALPFAPEIVTTITHFWLKG